MDPITSSSSSPSPEMLYLMNSCGLSEKSALTASTKIKFTYQSPPDSVITLLESYGFTKQDITKLISRRPRTLTCTVSILKSKLVYLFSKEISNLEVIKVICRNPLILHRSLEDHLAPFYDFVRNIVGTDRYVFPVLQKTSIQFSLELYEKLILKSFKVLRDEGVPEENIILFFRNHPRLFVEDSDRFKAAVQGVKSKGLDPCKSAFIETIRGARAISETTLEDRMNVYRKWGWTDEELEIAFKKYPKCLFVSVKKITAIMDYLVTQMGYRLSDFRRNVGIFTYSLEKRIIPRLAVYRYLISRHLIESSSIYGLLNLSEKAFLNKYLIEHEEVPELHQIYKQAFNKRVMEEGVQGSAVKEEDKPKKDEETAAVPMDEKFLEDNQASVLKRKLVLDNVEESKKFKRPKKVLKKSKNKVEEVQSRAAKKVEEDKPNEEEEIDESSVLKRKMVSNKVEGSKKAKMPKKVYKKLKKEVEEVQVSAKKEEEDKAKKEEKVAFPVAGKMLEDSQASVLNIKVSLDKVERSKNGKRPKKILKKSKNKLEPVQDNAAIKYDVEPPELLQASNRRFTEDSQSVEVIFCSEKARQTDEVGKPKKIASSSDLVEQEEELKKKEETKQAYKPKKILKKLKKKVEEVQGSATKKEEEVKSEEEEIAAFPNVERILENSPPSVLKRKLVLDTEEESKKVKKPKKLLKSKKKVEEEQCGGAKKNEHAKSTVEEDVAAVSIAEEVLEDSQASVLKSQVDLHEVEVPKKAKKSRS